MTGSRHTTLNARSLIRRKFKLPLDLLRLADPETLAEIWCFVRRAADVTGVGLSEPDSPMQTRARTVIFYDTDKFDLYIGTTSCCGSVYFSLATIQLIKHWFSNFAIRIAARRRVWIPARRRKFPTQ